MPGFITLADAKAHLVVQDDADNALIQDLVDAATRHVEAQTGYVAQRRDETFTCDFFGSQIEFRLRPVCPETIEVKYLDGDGGEQTFTDIRVLEKNGTTRLTPAIGRRWPSTACVPAAVRITARVGLGTTENAIAAASPSNIKHAVRLCVGSWYLDREQGAVPPAVGLLLDDERARRV